MRALSRRMMRSSRQIRTRLVGIDAPVEVLHAWRVE
jgi:hypothetical protein